MCIYPAPKQDYCNTLLQLGIKNKMPIDYSKYHPKWTLIRRLILKRAENKCEICGVDNYSEGYRDDSGNFWTEKNGIPGYAVIMKRIKIILTIAHLDHNRNNNDFDNLQALCQRCHLNHDRPQHIHNRKYGRETKRMNYNLFEEK